MKIAVAGACGRMGLSVIKMIAETEDMTLAGAFDRAEFKGRDAALSAGAASSGVLVSDSMNEAFDGCDCVVDFTNYSISAAVIKTAVQKGIPCVVGTTGHSIEDIEEIRKLSDKYDVPVLIVPNFSVGAVLMMKFAKDAAKYFKSAEIIELHHDKKVDSPSGTSMRTLEGMLDSRTSFEECPNEKENMPNARGASKCGVHIHSVRLPGLLAHQEVLFGSEGEYLTIRHDSMARTSFMTGVKLAVKNISKLKGLVVGLEAVMDF